MGGVDHTLISLARPAVFASGMARDCFYRFRKYTNRNIFKSPAPHYSLGEARLIVGPSLFPRGNASNRTKVQYTTKVRILHQLHINDTQFRDSQSSDVSVTN